MAEKIVLAYSGGLDTSVAGARSQRGSKISGVPSSSGSAGGRCGQEHCTRINTRWLRRWAGP